MKQIFCLGNSSVKMGDTEIPEILNDQVLIKTAVSALCGSELHGYRNDGFGNGNNGHEAAGTIVKVGDEIKHLKEGMRVGVSAVHGCGTCEQCKHGRYTWCENGFDYTGNMHSEYFAIPALACHVIPDDVPWPVAVLISGDGLGVPFHTSTKIPADTKTVAVFGLGPIGLGNVMLQASLGRTVIGIDLAQDRLNIAKSLGAAHIINATTDVVEQIKGLTDGKGADVCIEAAGIPITAQQCFPATRTAGTVIFNGEQPSVELSPSEDFIRRDITAMGAWFYHFHEFTDMLKLYRLGFPIESLVTHIYPPEHADVAFKMMASGHTGKVLIDYAATEPLIKTDMHLQAIEA
ncbi:Sorbitol dehydrogenase [Poriferisphaera corsica]|uniref:Sorbitol dehydrogenase n=1 Tax=Poriferisphaera corsica TaxID=2528020 RepID=A0A517YSM9_9BACT|nr:zinc-binding dehydrogenase [Poriferisphaera corsica]QDU33245.1 Sorbitol dehydrogenase [Poriferisphaera corsica]